MKPSRFERHPRLTVALLVLLSLGAVVAAIEMLPLFPKDPWLGAAPPDAKPILERRVVRLKEHLPAYRTEITPSDDYLADTQGLEKRAYSFEVDEDGFIQPSRIHADPELTIAFLGGSTTECMYVDADARFPYVAGRILEKDLGLKVNSLNSGVSGNHTMHANVLLLSKILPLKPQFVVLMEAVNDLGSMQILGSYWNESQTRSMIIRENYDDGAYRITVLRALKSLLYATFPNTYRILKGAADRLSGSISGQRMGAMERKAPELDEFAAERDYPPQRDPDRVLEDFRRSLETFVGISRAWGVQPVLMTQPNRLWEPRSEVMKHSWQRLARAGISLDDMARQMNRFNQVIREVAASRDVLLIDLVEQVPANNQTLYDGVHYTRQGSLMVAERVARGLEPAIRAEMARRK